MTNPMRERFFQVRRRHLGDYGLLSLDPLIVSVPLQGDELSHFVEKFQVLLDPMRDEPIHFFGFFGCAVTDYIMGELAKLEQAARIAFPGLRMIYACNNPDEPAWFAQRDAEAFYCSKTAMIDERVFRPLPEVPRRFDAVYDARFIPVKRHALAEGVEQLGLLYYPLPTDDQDYVLEVHRRLAHGHFFNHGSDGKYRLLNPEEVNHALNQCRVGLCLSEDEGPMRASVQYLLSGLPIVTTPSRGGRDVWYEEQFVRIVPPDRDAVRDAVRELAGQAIPPETIRRATLARARRHRQVFIEQVQAVYDRLKVGRSFQAEWDDVFSRGLFTSRSHLRTLDRIREARGRPPG